MVKHIIEYIKNLSADIVDALYEDDYENMPVMKEKFKPKVKKKKESK
jgi:hypothetical protein